MNFKGLLLISILVMTITSLFARQYEAPPSSSTSSRSVPYISDEAMEQCVKLYNEAKWLNEEIDNTYVNQYSQESVDTYNRKVNKHSNMINIFNRDCAGKQSYSAWKAAQKLNGN